MGNTAKRFISIIEGQKEMEEQVEIKVTQTTLRKWCKQRGMTIQPGGPRSNIYVNYELFSEFLDGMKKEKEEKERKKRHAKN